MMPTSPKERGASCGNFFGPQPLSAFQQNSGQPEIPATTLECPYIGEQRLRNSITAASGHNIPSGRRILVTHQLPQDAAKWIKERDGIRKTDPTSPEISTLNNKIHMAIRNSKTAKWREFLDTFDHRTNSAKLWKTIKQLDGKQTKESRNQPIKFKCKRRKKTFTSAKDLAERFNKQFTCPSVHKTAEESRKVSRKIHKRPLDDHVVVTTDQVIKAIKKAKNSKATGPDGISMIHMKHLGPKAIQLLTDTFNLSLKKSQIPAIWKSSIIIPLLKPGKPANESSSYRPISLLCPAIKILEKCILPVLQEHLRTATHQHGFKPRHSTVTALNELSTAIADGFNQRQPADRTVLVALDLSKAFDTVCHTTLLKILHESTLPGSMVRWLAAYLRGRQAQTLCRDVLSKARIVRFGVPQGSVIAPTLFNFYVADAPTPPPNIFLVSYADDFTIYALGTDIEKVAREINEYLATLCQFLDARALEVSTPKCSVTLFTPWTKQHKTHPKILLNGLALELKKTPKVLGVIFDTAFTFSPHCKAVATKGRSRLNILKALAGTTWGQSKETLIMTFQTLIRPVLEYAAPVWTPVASATNIELLQRVQNAALRVATGCTKMSSIDHLHHETKVLPVRRHTRVRCAQTQLSHHMEEHPGHHFLSLPTPPREIMKATLNSRYEHYIKSLFGAEDENASRTTTINENEYTNLLKEIHTDEVADMIAEGATKKNPVLDANWLDIDKSEEKLTRKERRTLAQLRSGYSPYLAEYMHRIKPSTSKYCPKCEVAVQSTKHLFNCPANPTTMTVEDLWKNPVQASLFLELDKDGNTVTNQSGGSPQP